MASSEVDAVILTGYFGGYSYYGSALGSAENQVADALVATTRHLGSLSSSTPCTTASLRSEPLARLRAGHLPLSDRIEEAVAILVRMGNRRGADTGRLPEVLPAAPQHLEAGYFGCTTALAEAGSSSRRRLKPATQPAW